MNKHPKKLSYTKLISIKLLNEQSVESHVHNWIANLHFFFFASPHVGFYRLVNLSLPLFVSLFSFFFTSSRFSLFPDLCMCSVSLAFLRSFSSCHTPKVHSAWKWGLVLSNWSTIIFLCNIIFSCDVHFLWRDLVCPVNNFLPSNGIRYLPIFFFYLISFHFIGQSLRGSTASLFILGIIHISWNKSIQISLSGNVQTNKIYSHTFPHRLCVYFSPVEKEYKLIHLTCQV